MRLSRGFVAGTLVRVTEVSWLSEYSEPRDRASGGTLRNSRAARSATRVQALTLTCKV